MFVELMTFSFNPKLKSEYRISGRCPPFGDFALTSHARDTHPPMLKGAVASQASHVLLHCQSEEYDPPLPPALTSSSVSYWGSFIYISARQKGIRGSLKVEAQWPI